MVPIYLSPAAIGQSQASSMSSLEHEEVVASAGSSQPFSEASFVEAGLEIRVNKYPTEYQCFWFTNSIAAEFAQVVESNLPIQALQPSVRLSYAGSEEDVVVNFEDMRNYADDEGVTYVGLEFDSTEVYWAEEQPADPPQELPSQVVHLYSPDLDTEILRALCPDTLAGEASSKQVGHILEDIEEYLHQKNIATESS